MLEERGFEERWLHPSRERELTDLITGSAWFLGVLEAAARAGAPEWWIGAGVLRDLVWDTRFGQGFDPTQVKDVDLAFFDARDLSPERDADVEGALAAQDPALPWEAKNQAAVHHWYPRRFGVDVEPLRSTLDGIATWPEFATAVAVRLDGRARLQIAAPFGLDDLLDGIWRRNPRRVTRAEYARRVAHKQPERRWPALTVVAVGEE